MHLLQLMQSFFLWEQMMRSVSTWKEVETLKENESFDYRKKNLPSCHKLSHFFGSLYKWLWEMIGTQNIFETKFYIQKENKNFSVYFLECKSEKLFWRLLENKNKKSF